MGELVYLVSVAGHPNFGDEAIVAGWLRFLARVRPNAEVVLDCPHPASARTLFQGMHPQLSVTDALWRACDGSSVKGAAGVWPMSSHSF
ncbi:polysaccharide pyruvyl transferase WcaK-like protein [Arthrobacter sp. PL16]|nr:polysaccharide pyruvyl transferase WcaK-like protein [Arthrobacter sp. PL16]